MTVPTRLYETIVTVKNGRVEVSLPQDFPDGEAFITVKQTERPFNPETDWTAEEWAELQSLQTPNLKTGAEIVAMIESGELDLSGWEDMGITDSVQWVEEQREQRRKKRGL